MQDKYTSATGMLTYDMKTTPPPSSSAPSSSNPCLTPLFSMPQTPLNSTGSSLFPTSPKSITSEEKCLTDPPSHNSDLDLDLNLERTSNPLEPQSEEGRIYEQKIQSLTEYINNLPNELQQINQHIAKLTNDRKHALKSRNDFTYIRRIDIGLQQLNACKQMIESGYNERIIRDRLDQMITLYNQLPLSEKNEFGKLESWKSIFDVNAVIPKTLAKDNCENCHAPLILIKKQALLSCAKCARLTDHIMPLSSGSHHHTTTNWSSSAKPSSTSVSITKMIKNSVATGIQSHLSVPNSSNMDITITKSDERCVDVRSSNINNLNQTNKDDFHKNDDKSNKDDLEQKGVNDNSNTPSDQLLKDKLHKDDKLHKENKSNKSHKDNKSNKSVLYLSLADIKNASKSSNSNSNLKNMEVIETSSTNINNALTPTTTSSTSILNPSSTPPPFKYLWHDVTKSSKNVISPLTTSTSTSLVNDDSTTSKSDIIDINTKSSSSSSSLINKAKTDKKKSLKAKQKQKEKQKEKENSMSDITPTNINNNNKNTTDDTIENNNNNVFPTATAIATAPSTTAFISAPANVSTENKRIKTVLQKLGQFRSGGITIPNQVIVQINEYLRSRHHSGNGLITVIAVIEALDALDHHKYIPVAPKLTNILNGQPIRELSEQEFFVICERLQEAQKAAILENISFNPYFVNQICDLMNLPIIAAAFPPNRTARILRAQTEDWRKVYQRLRSFDSKYQW
jgi:hypothetical protein